MRAQDWIETPVESLLDVGCNVGAWLSECDGRYPEARLAGVDINYDALAKARQQQPWVDYLRAGAERLPFRDGSFQYVTCFETLEHLPVENRAGVFEEIRRVLKPGGRLILSVPHDGWFSGLDSNNLRFRFPSLYRRVVGRGLRDGTYTALQREVEWHHHFTESEIRGLAGGTWEVVAVCRYALILYPLADFLSWPLYRLGLSDHPLRLMLQRIAGWECRFDFGRASYNMTMVLERI